MENKIKWQNGMNFQATDTDGDVFQFKHLPVPLYYEFTQSILWDSPYFHDNIFVRTGDPISVEESRDSLIARKK